MNEQDFREMLHEALVMYSEEGGIIEGVRTYEQDHFLSTHSGLMVRLSNGEVFNLMVIKDVSDHTDARVGKSGGGLNLLHHMPKRSGTRR